MLSFIPTYNLMTAGAAAYVCMYVCMYVARDGCAGYRGTGR